MKVGLAQINYRSCSYLPYSVGSLQAYVEHHAASPRQFEFLLPLYKRVSVDAAVRQLQGADVVAFSTYIWNARISLAIAARLKMLSHGTVIVFGGPQVPNRAESYLRQHPFIDVVCRGEGESAFLSLLEHCEYRDWGDVPSISYVNGDGDLVENAQAPRTRDLQGFPSPYLTGVFEPLMGAASERWSVAWETNRGCPFSCTFCDWGSAVNSKVHLFALDRVLEELDWFGFHEIPYVFCCDANFGIAARDLEIAEFAVKCHERYGYPRSVIVQNTKNATERAYRVQKILSDAGLIDGVDLAIQSNDPLALANIKRNNISLVSFHELQRRFKRDHVNTYTDVILGLPGETYDSFADGTSRLIENGQHNRIKFSNLSVLPNAEMGDPEYRRRHGMEVVGSPMINHSEAIESADVEIAEVQDLVVATTSMPRDAWVRTRVFAWMASLLHFGRLLHIPFVVLHEITGIGFRKLIEAFSEPRFAAGTVLSEMQEFFTDRARDLQAGGPEYHCDTAWLNVWLYFDEYLLIQLCRDGRLDAFYAEAHETLASLLAKERVSVPDDLLAECIQTNQALLRLPFHDDVLVLQTRYNIKEIYRSALAGERVALAPGGEPLQVDRTGGRMDSWEEWCREVVLHGHRNKKGSLLYW